MLQNAIRIFPAVLCLWTADVASAQTATAPTNAPSAVAPTPAIALADIAAQAETTLAKLRDDQTSLSSDPTTATAAADIPLLTRQLDDRMAEDEELLNGSPTLTSLQNAQESWQALGDSLAATNKTLSDQAGRAARLLTELAQQIQVWQATLASAQTSAASAEVLQRIKAVLTSIGTTTKMAQAAQAQVFSVQALAAAQDTRIKVGSAALAKAQEDARTRLLQQDRPPLWKAEALWTEGGAIAHERASFRLQILSLVAYLREKSLAIWINLLILIFFVIGFHWIRNVIRARAREDAALRHAAHVFAVPVATGLLLGLVATWWLYPQAPRLLWAGVGAAALIPAVVIIRRLIEPALFPCLYAVVLAYFFDQLRNVLIPASSVSRLLFIFELMAASVFLLWLLHSSCLVASSGQTGRLVSSRRLYAHVAFLVFVFAGFANVFGYAGLSRVMGNGMLEGSYLAVTFYAGVLIIDALLATALKLPPLNLLGMVQRHRALLYRNALFLIRWLAFLLWAMVTLQVLTVRHLLWQHAKTFLSATHEWGSISFSVGHLLACGITIWAAFLLARFVRFVLEEDVYPHLNLGRGIPYATSTVVRYTILVLGFFTALGALGIPSTTFSIVAGSIGVGLGFGMQNIMNNFVSGVILLFERPIKVGDIIQVDTSMGVVERIDIRASVIRLTNGSEVIVPNSNLISNPVTNWTLSNNQRVIEIPVGVTAKADSQHVLELLEQVAKEQPAVLKNPPPQVLLVTFGATALTFRIRAWVDADKDWMQVTSDLSLAINAALTRENIALS